jgi:FkbH-like protein
MTMIAGPPSIVDMAWLPDAPQDFSLRCKGLTGSDHALGAELQFLATHRMNTRQLSLLSKAVAKNIGRDLTPLSKFRLGVLSSSTIDILVSNLAGSAARYGVALEVATTAYGQVMQEALDPASAINRSRLDAVLLFIDHRWLKLDRPRFSKNSAVEDAMEQVESIVAALRKNGNTPAILQTLAQPPEPLFGSYDRRFSGSVRAMIDEVNRRLVALADRTGSYLIDAAALAEQIGTTRWFDPVQWLSYKLPISAECCPVYADMLGRLLGAIRGKSRKCLVLDLDNTVWGGVIGDDGLAGIEVGQGSARGEAFLAVQQLALDLRERGVILAASSKNDDATARLPFRDHQDMLLRERHITVFQANWIDKASNLEAIAKTIGIGLDALVLLDDNPAERAHIRAALPQVAVPELPDDPSWFPWYLASAGYFEAISFAEEDRLRVQSYAADAQRADVMAKARDVGDYLGSLGMTISFKPFDEVGRARVAQLINKTNQFNLTTRRYTENEVAAFAADSKVFTLQVRLADKFGDLGMIGVVICREGGAATWEIDTWLMSCRVLGRRVEEAMLARVAAAARERAVTRLIGTYVPTAKNGMVADHYVKLGFRKVDEKDGATRWELDLAGYATPSLPMRVEGGAAGFSQAAE